MRYLLHDVFVNASKRNPEKKAIINENGSFNTYGDLDRLSNQYANLFVSLKNDITKFPYVGVLSSIHTNSIASVLGTLKAGCAYVPLDEYSPVVRLEHIIKNTQLDTIVVDPCLYDNFSTLFDWPEIKNVIFLDETVSGIRDDKIFTHSDVSKQPSSGPRHLNQVSDDLAYILHSSGSTGVPKGIMLTHRNARTFVDWMHKEFKITDEDVIMSRAPFKFDLSVFDIFNTFMAGATLVCYDWNKTRERDKKHADYVKLMEKERATVLYTTPSTFISLLNRGGLGEADLNLRTIMYAGEPFPVAQLRRLRTALPYTSIANIYGPTETNIITYFWIDSVPDDDSASIPLGDVVEDTEVIVVSEDQSHICAPNELGELWCRGGTVTLGYLWQDEKTKENLVKSPFHRYPAYFWRTGDFGFKDEMGCLHYRGRKDHMVKVKGFRIEIGEVENAISSFEGIDEFAVVAKPDMKYGNRLYCYYAMMKGKSISPNDLVQYARNKLPEYMIPYEFVQMDVLPKTSSGKVDRVLLSQQAT